MVGNKEPANNRQTQSGNSKKLLVSLANATDPEIGEYRRKEDGSGGAFYIGDFDETFASKRKNPQTLKILDFPWLAGFVYERRGWDSNPCALADKRFSRPPRYDHFDTSPIIQL